MAYMGSASEFCRSCNGSFPDIRFSYICNGRFVQKHYDKNLRTSVLKDYGRKFQKMVRRKDCRR